MKYDAENPPPWSRTEQGCPLEPPQRAWIETSLRWFVDQFGTAPVLADPVLPTPAFLPAPYSGTTAQIADLVADVCELMSIDHSKLTLQLFRRASENGAGARGGTRAVGHYFVEDGRPVIALDVAEASDARYLTAIIAHELSHVRLLGEKRVTADRKDHERLTDLLTVFFGFGIFSTNAALRYGETARGWSVTPLGDMDERALNAARNDGYTRLGYLAEREFAYALACCAWLRGETDPSWAAHLDPGPRATVAQSLAYLVRTAPPGDLPTRASSPVPARIVPNRGKPWQSLPAALPPGCPPRPRGGEDSR